MRAELWKKQLIQVKQVYVNATSVPEHHLQEPSNNGAVMSGFLRAPPQRVKPCKQTHSHPQTQLLSKGWAHQEVQRSLRNTSRSLFKNIKNWPNVKTNKQTNSNTGGIWESVLSNVGTAVGVILCFTLKSCGCLSAGSNTAVGKWEFWLLVQRDIRLFAYLEGSRKTPPTVRECKGKEKQEHRAAKASKLCYSIVPPE